MRQLSRELVLKSLLEVNTDSLPISTSIVPLTFHELLARSYAWTTTVDFDQQIVCLRHYHPCVNG